MCIEDLFPEINNNFINYIIDKEFNIDNNHIHKQYNTKIINKNINLQVIDDKSLLINNKIFFALVNKEKFYLKYHKQKKEIFINSKKTRKFSFIANEISLKNNNKIMKYIKFQPEANENSIAYGETFFEDILILKTQHIDNNISFTKNNYNIKEVETNKNYNKYFFYDKTIYDKNIYAEIFHEIDIREFNYITLNNQNNIIDFEFNIKFLETIEEYNILDDIKKIIRENFSDKEKINDIKNHFLIIKDNQKTIENIIFIIKKLKDINEKLILKNKEKKDIKIEDNLFTTSFCKMWVQMNNEIVKESKNICYEEKMFFILNGEKKQIELLQDNFIFKQIKKINNLFS